MADRKATSKAQITKAQTSKATHSTQIDVVQVDGLVVLKIVKHCQDEGSAGDVVQGVLLGLIHDKKLEVTNCFPFPKADDDDDEDSTLHYQMEMMRRLRAVNIDHLHVGWYQSTYLGSYLNKALLDSQYSYQKAIEESVVLIYDPLRTGQGMLSLRAYRLSKNMMDLYKDGEFTPERIAKRKINFHSMFEEIPLVVKNSTLENALLCELEEQDSSADSDRFLSLATGSYLEKNVRLLMESVDELCQDANKYHNYQRNQARQQQQKDAYQQRRQAENNSRQQKGEPPLPEEDLSKIFKPLPAPSRLDSLLLAGQINAYSHQVNHFATQSFGKLFLAEALQEKKQ